MANISKWPPLKEEKQFIKIGGKNQKDLILGLKIGHHKGFWLARMKNEKRLPFQDKSS